MLIVLFLCWVNYPHSSISFFLARILFMSPCILALLSTSDWESLWASKDASSMIYLDSRTLRVLSILTAGASLYECMNSLKLSKFAMRFFQYVTFSYSSGVLKSTNLCINALLLNLNYFSGSMSIPIYLRALTAGGVLSAANVKIPQRRGTRSFA